MAYFSKLFAGGMPETQTPSGMGSAAERLDKAAYQPVERLSRAILAEIVATSAMEASDGFGAKPWSRTGPVGTLKTALGEMLETCESAFSHPTPGILSRYTRFHRVALDCVNAAHVTESDPDTALLDMVRWAIDSHAEGFQSIAKLANRLHGDPTAMDTGLIDRMDTAFEALEATLRLAMRHPVSRELGSLERMAVSLLRTRLCAFDRRHGEDADAALEGHRNGLDEAEDLLSESGLADEPLAILMEGLADYRACFDAVVRTETEMRRIGASIRPVVEECLQKLDRLYDRPLPATA